MCTAAAILGTCLMLGFIVAAIAGFFTPQIEGPVTKPLIKALEGTIKVEPSEVRAVSFMVALFGGAIVAALMDSGSTFGVILGAILGYFGARIYAALRRVIEGRRDAD